MTAEEVEEYITQIAFSGATQFLEKYKDKTTDDEMIGHFGLGFYSAFMVADEVHIDTLSYKDGAAPVHWVSQGGTESVSYTHLDVYKRQRQRTGMEPQKNIHAMGHMNLQNLLRY